MQRRHAIPGRRPTDQRSPRAHRPAGFSIWLALVALLLQVVVPLGQAVPLPAGSDPPLRALVVCTAYGPRTMDAGADARGGASPSAASAHGCPVCSALGFCGAPAPMVAAPLPAAGPLIIRAEPSAKHHPDRTPPSVRARGPPPAVA